MAALLEGAREEIGVLVYAALFLAEDARGAQVLAEQARAAVRVRLLVGDPDSPAVARRGEEEGIGAVAIGAKIRNVLALFRPLLEAGAEIRLHGTVLYNSMYRADDDLLVNPTSSGTSRPAPRAAPAPHLWRRHGRHLPRQLRAHLGRRRAVDRGLTVGRKIDYHDDPAAPEPNSLVPAVSVVVARDDGAILLIRRTDNGTWALPGGAIEMSESVRAAGIRETLEETGIDCEITGLAGVYSDPGHVIHYTSNDEVRREFSIVLTARPVAGQPTPSAESSEVRWVSPDDLGEYTMDRSMRKRVDDYVRPARRTGRRLALAFHGGSVAERRAGMEKCS